MSLFFEWLMKLELFNTNLLVILLLCLVIIVILDISKWLWNRRDLYILSAKLPGPLSFPIIGSLPQILKLASRHGDPISAMCKFIFQYPGGVSRIWLGPDLVVFLSNPEDIEVIMKSKLIYAKPPRFFGFACELIGAGLLTSLGLDGKWKTHRRIMSPSFNSSVLRSHQPIIQHHSEIFLNDLEQLIGTEYKDYHIFIGRYVADTVSDSLFDYKINFREGKHDDVINALDKLTDISFKKVYKVWYYIDYLYNLSSLKIKQNEATNALSNYAKMVYEAKMKEYGNNNDQRPNVLLNLLDHECNGELDHDEVLDEIKTIWAAGVDTIIGDTCWILLMLAMHKDAQDKVFQEIKKFYKDKKDTPVESDNLVHFPYLDMCVKEVLRLFPVAPVNFRYVTESITLIRNNLTIPPNTTIGMVVLASHRDPTVWVNPNEFIPERFSSEETSNRHQYAFYPFSGGNRNCIGMLVEGQRYGFNFLKTATVYILRKYEIHSEMKFKDLGLYYDVNVKPKTGFQAKFTRRNWF